MDLETLITSKHLLIDYCRQGNKPEAQWKIGLEHEKFLMTTDNRRANFDDHIQPLFRALADNNGWEPIYDQQFLVALKKGQASLTLEPGGQFELSGAPQSSLVAVEAELEEHFATIAPHLKQLGLKILLMGYDPHTTLENVPWMPKQRYKIMAPYMQKKGALGQEMMTNTTTVQVNLDYDSEPDMVMKFRVSVALQSIATALFANSPMKNGKATGFQSYRRHIWTQTDSDRCGLPLFVFDKDMGFEKYVDYALAVPMYFIVRNGIYISMAGLSFQDFIDGRVPIDYQATLGDWADHLTTIFTEVRLKTYLEMRGADGGDKFHLMALPAYWTGLLYHRPTLEKAYAWISTWSQQTITAMAETAAVQGIHGLKAEAIHSLDLAYEGLRAYEPGSIHYLDYLGQIIEDDKSAADHYILYKN